MRIAKWIVLVFTIALIVPVLTSAQQAQASSSPQGAGTGTAQAPIAFFTLKPLGHNVFAAIANPGSGAGSNSGFVIGDDGVLVVDTFQNVNAAKALLDEIRKMTPLPVKYVVNTHYHIDHVTGNQVF